MFKYFGGPGGLEEHILCITASITSLMLSFLSIKLLIDLNLN